MTKKTDSAAPTIDAESGTVPETLASRSDFQGTGAVGVDAARPSGVAGATLAGVNDNHRFGYLPMAPGAGEPVAANDDDVVPPSAPGGARVPVLWMRGDPHVVQLHAALVRAREAAGTAPERRLLTWLIGVAEGDGVLPSVNNRIALRAVSKASAIGKATMNPGRPARVIVDEFGPSFRLAAVQTRMTCKIGLRPRPNLVVVMADLAGRYEAEGRDVPIDMKGRISWAALEREAGLEQYRLRNCKRAMAEFGERVADGRLRLSRKSFQPPRMTNAEIDARIAELMAVVAGFDVPGGKVPEAPERRGIVGWRHIASLTGRVEPTMERHEGYRALVKEVVARRGLLLPGLNLGDDTLAALREAGLAMVRERQVDKGSKTVDAAVANHKSVFDRMVAAVDANGEDCAVVVFGPETFDAALDRCLETFDNARSAANFRRAALWWRERREARLGASGLPASFGEAFEALLSSRQIGPSALAAMIGCKPWTLQSMVSGKHGVTAATVPIVRASEEALGVAPGTLLDKAVHGFRGSGHDRVATDWYRKLSKKIRPLLPPEAMHWSEERLAGAVTQVSGLISGGTAYGRMHAAARSDEYRLPPFDAPDRLRDQLYAYQIHKTAEIAFPFLRAPGARWKTEKAVSMRMRSLELPFRMIASAVADGPTGGLGVDRDLTTIAMLAVAPLMFASIGLRVVRFADLDVDGKPRGIRFGSCERELVQHLVSITNPITGWLVQNPDLAATLVPLDLRARTGIDDALLKAFGTFVDGPLLSAEDVRDARADWPSFVGRAHSAYLQALSYVDDVMEVSRDPIAAVAGLVEADEPQAELLCLLLDAERRWADERTDPTGYRGDVRDSVMHRLASITAFRPSNLTDLVYTGDETGEIRKRDGRWELELSYRAFKNWRSTRLFGTRTARRNYHLVLPDEAGLYALLDRFFHDVRPAMVCTANERAAFLGRFGRPITSAAWWEACRAFGVRNIAHNPVLGTGFPGVVSMFPYAFRHIKASDTLKNGVSNNRLEEAANALQTSELMVQRHYGFLRPEEATRSSVDTYGRAARLAQKRLGR